LAVTVVEVESAAAVTVMVRCPWPRSRNAGRAACFRRQRLTNGSSRRRRPPTHHRPHACATYRSANRRRRGRPPNAISS